MKRKMYITPSMKIVPIPEESFIATSTGGIATGYGLGGNMIDDGLDMDGAAGGYGAGNDMFGGY